MSKGYVAFIETQDGNIQSVRGSKRSLSILDVSHRANHEGKLYRVPYFKTVAASSWAVVWLYSPSTTIECHLYINYSADNSGYVDIWKGVVSATSQWAAIVPVIANAWSTNVSQVVAYSGGVPTTSTATLQNIESIGSGGKTTFGGAGGLLNEIVMAPATTYAVRFFNTSTEADVAFNFNLYEEDHNE